MRGQGASQKWGKFSLLALIWTLLKLPHTTTSNCEIWVHCSWRRGLSASWHPVSCIWDPPQSTGLNFLQSLNCVSKSFICKIFVLLILWQLSHSFLPSTDIKHLLCIFYISTKRSFYFLHYRDFVFCKNLVSASEAKFWNKVVTFNQTFVLGATSEGNGPGQW